MKPKPKLTPWQRYNAWCDEHPDVMSRDDPDCPMSYPEWARAHGVTSEEPKPPRRKLTQAPPE